MINTDDLIVLYRNNVAVNYGRAGAIRGFNQDRIMVSFYANDDYVAPTDTWRNSEMYRDGICPNPEYVVKSVSEAEWLDAKYHVDEIRKIKEQQKRQEEENREKLIEELREKAEVWYNALSPNEQQMVMLLSAKFGPWA